MGYLMDLSEVNKEFVPQFSVPLVEQIAKFLADAIIEGRLDGGQRLVENELQRNFSISRAPIREAFRVLEKNGLVVIIPRKGTFVRKVNQKDIVETFTIRAHLEGLAARLATAHFDEQDIRKIESIFSGMKEGIKKKDFTSYRKYHSEYHSTYINSCGNDRLIEILGTLRIQSIWYRFMHDYFQEWSEYSAQVHREILDLFIKKDADRVETLVKDHIMFVLNWYLQSSTAKGS
jgi:DNA-binding GntR family transcriptional regulator